MVSATRNVDCNLKTGMLSSIVARLVLPTTGCEHSEIPKKKTKQKNKNKPSRCDGDFHATPLMSQGLLQRVSFSLVTDWQCREPIVAGSDHRHQGVDTGAAVGVLPRLSRPDQGHRQSGRYQWVWNTFYDVFTLAGIFLAARKSRKCESGFSWPPVFP